MFSEYKEAIQEDSRAADFSFFNFGMYIFYEHSLAPISGASLVNTTWSIKVAIFSFLFSLVQL